MCFADPVTIENNVAGELGDVLRMAMAQRSAPKKAIGFPLRNNAKQEQQIDGIRDQSVLIEAFPSWQLETSTGKGHISSRPFPAPATSGIPFRQ